jgi:hypothetical protein
MENIDNSNDSCNIDPNWLETSAISRFWFKDDQGKQVFDEAYYLAEIDLINGQQPIELWKPIPEFERYFCSNLSRVRRGNKIKKINIETARKNNKYIDISLNKDNKSYSKKLHRIVAHTWIPNPYRLKTVNHKDGDKYNNRLDNLEWMSTKDNNKHARDTELNPGRTIGYSVIQFTKDYKREIARWLSYAIAEKTLGIYSGDISKVCRGINRTAGGYGWRRADESDGLYNDKEIRAIPGFPGYTASRDGIVFGLKNQKLEAQEKNGYHVLSLKKYNAFHGVHYFIALAFVSNSDPRNKTQIDHIDTNKLNNHASNLRWVTTKENMNNKITKNKLVHKVQKYSLDNVLLRNYPSKKIAAIYEGVASSTINQWILKGQIYGYIWKSDNSINLKSENDPDEYEESEDEELKNGDDGPGILNEDFLKSIEMFTIDGKFLKVFANLSELAIRLNRSTNEVYEYVLTGKFRNHTFKFVNPEDEIIPEDYLTRRIGKYTKYGKLEEVFDNLEEVTKTVNLRPGTLYRYISQGITGKSVWKFID